MDFLPGVPYVHTEPAVAFAEGVEGFVPGPLSNEELRHGRRCRARSLTDVLPVRRQAAAATRIPILFGLSILVFAGCAHSRRARPGAPGRASDAGASRSHRAAYGLDRPVVRPVREVPRPSVARSTSATAIADPAAGRRGDGRERFPATIELAIAAMMFAVGVGIPLGYSRPAGTAPWLDNLSRRRVAARRRHPGVLPRPTSSSTSSRCSSAGSRPAGGRTHASTPSTRPASTSSTG